MGSTIDEVINVATQQQQQQHEQHVGVAAIGVSRDGRNWSGSRTRTSVTPLLSQGSAG
jgi:hypothetical protein